MFLPEKIAYAGKFNPILLQFNPRKTYPLEVILSNKTKRNLENDPKLVIQLLQLFLISFLSYIYTEHKEVVNKEIIRKYITNENTYKQKIIVKD